MNQRNKKLNYLTGQGAPFAKAIDLALVLYSGWFAYAIYFYQWDILEERYSWAILVGTILAAFVLPFFNIYSSWKGVLFRKIICDMLLAYFAWGVSVIIVMFLFKLSDKFPRGWIVCWGGGAFLCSLVCRFIEFEIYSKVLLRKKYNVVLIGDASYCLEAEKSILSDKSSEFRVSRVFVSKYKGILPNNWSLYKSISDINVEEEEVWICLPISKGNMVISIVNALDKKSINIRFMPGMHEMRLINHKMSVFSGVRLLDISCSPMTVGKRFLKRIEDFALSLMILFFISPLLLFIALGVKLTSAGPIFYTQSRVSWNGKVFQMIKFRSMNIDNEKEKVEWGNASSKKVTTFGKFIRKTSLDELPQLINVLKGDMSIVGPRPERDIFVQKFGEEIPGYMQKHMVKAGITGWAQVHGLRGDTSLARRVEYDLWYIENWSLWLDIKIIFMTFFKIISDKSAS